ncbi:phage tail sheath family protein [Sphingomonas sp. DT-207]|uniref:phage tail sheath family protein n=1 Tax=Sphingomonas sp. DT-207 TaxID=3396167 RepID=UPI003F1BBB73
MPEYLAPAVYVEEVPSANKPIEGASTSTAAMVGLAARGPVNTPTLVTSSGAFNRLFGGLLDPRVFTDGLDSMPQAALGFFANGGSRLYVTRIVGAAATRASASIWGAAAGSTAGVTLAARATAGATRIALSDATDVDADVDFVIADGTRSEAVQTTGAAAQTLVLLGQPLAGAVADNAAVTEQTVTDGAAQTGMEDMLAGGGLAFDPVLALPAGTILRIRDTGDPDIVDYVTIATANTNEIVEPGLLHNHPAATTEVHVVTVADGAGTAADGNAPAGSEALWVDNASAFAAGNVVAVTTSLGTEFRVVAAAPQVATLAAPLANPHAAGTAIQAVSGLMQVHARYPGAWGNALVVRAVPTSLLGGTVTEPASSGALSLKLNSTFGLFAGSALQIGTGPGAQLVTVASVNRATNEVTLVSGLAADVDDNAAVASREFNLFVDRYENDKVVESEQFEGLALHPDHARYAPRSVGAFDRQSQISAESGASELIRISDLSMDDAGTDLADAAALRQSSPIAGGSFQMSGGNDDLGSIDDNSFIGTASDDPHLRTGIQALENENSVSIVAVPGRTSVGVQNALLEHCEKMRYRFAVIEPPAGSRVAQARTHRQNFDSTRGAIYYPWLDVADPVGAPGDMIRIPPSGHVMGIYARTDVARGVWRAPANEVVRGILQLDTALSKGEQDILNPVHVNCFRDFRSVNRGLRLYGARTLSSDPEFRYVNVRRTLLFIEQSLDTGLQWAVFEPNAEPLWASVKQSVSAFLRTVWRDGGLEGTTEEEAFFVDIGYDKTMTQADIDNGRLIVVVGVAIVKPAEFVIVRISQKTREATS